MSFELPRNLAETAARNAPAACRAWLDTLPKVVADLLRSWALRQVGPPIQPGGQCSWVAPVRAADGQDLVLKVGWRHPEAMHEAEALRTWNGNGAVVVHAARTNGDTSALLLERCVPGGALKDALAEPEQDLVVAELLSRLWVEPEAGHAFRRLQVMCDDWAHEFESKLASAPQAVDRGLARAAMELFRRLPATADRRVLLCTDLHAENILAAQREPWLAIDPKPYVGDPTYDVLQHMLNCRERLATDPRSLVLRLADLAQLDAERLTAWLFARAVQQCLDLPWLVDVARRVDPT